MKIYFASVNANEIDRQSRENHVKIPLSALFRLFRTFCRSPVDQSDFILIHSQMCVRIVHSRTFIGSDGVYLYRVDTRLHHTVLQENRSVDFRPSTDTKKKSERRKYLDEENQSREK